MAARDAEAEVPKYEISRHEMYWRGFVRFMLISALGTALLLAGMAFFLL